MGDLSQRQGVAQSPPRPSIPLLSATSSSASRGLISFDSAAATRLRPKGASITSDGGGRGHSALRIGIRRPASGRAGQTLQNGVGSASQSLGAPRHVDGELVETRFADGISETILSVAVRCGARQHLLETVGNLSK